MKLLIMLTLLCSVSASAQRFEYHKAIGIGIDSLWQNEEEKVIAAGFELLGPPEILPNGAGYVSTTGIVKLMGLEVGGLNLILNYGLVTYISLSVHKADFKRWANKLKKLKSPSLVKNAGAVVRYEWVFDNCEVSLLQTDRSKYAAELTITPIASDD